MPTVNETNDKATSKNFYSSIGIVCMLLSVLCCIACHDDMGLNKKNKNKITR